MSMKVTFEAQTARELFRQMADFITVGTDQAEELAPEAPTPVKEIVPDMAKVEALADALKPPTPAVKNILDLAGVTEDEWKNIPRTGKNGRMTQADAKSYIASKKSTVKDVAVPEEPPAKFPSHELDQAMVDTFGKREVKVGPGNEQTPADQILDELGVPPVEEEEPAIPEATLDDAKAAMQKVYTCPNGGRESCLVMLDRFGAKRMADVPADRFGEWVYWCDKVVAGEVEPQNINPAGARD